MKEIHKENWEIIHSNLTAAHGDLIRLEARLEYLHTGKEPEGWEGFARSWDKSKFSTLALFGHFDHIYHHINFAWNSRYCKSERVIACAWGDFREWSKFPSEFDRFVPAQKHITNREPLNGKIEVFNLRRNVREALMHLECALDVVCKQLNDTGQYAEDALSQEVERTLAHLNEAWHCRRYDIERQIELGGTRRNLERWQKYPPEFSTVLTTGIQSRR